VTPFTELTTPTRQPGAEPLPGYRLISPLGRGGFGEVWKCEAPGGLLKAIKFIPGGGEECRRELSAFDRIKTIRHPYLLTLERVEHTGSDLLMVMELADCQFLDRFNECREQGQTGIPREELLGYLKETAEALDTISTRHGLQHLDVKPQNLFLVSGHAKVGDYGLVRSMERVAETQGHRGFTPRYTAPEVLQGGLDPRSDQYSLALVFVELLTGGFPYSGQTAPQLILQHVTAQPNLSGLPSRDRAVVSRALSKDPTARFPSCTAFIRALPLQVVEPVVAHVSEAPASRPLLRAPTSAELRAKLEPPAANPTATPDQTIIARKSTHVTAVPLRRAGPQVAPPPSADQFSHFRPVMSVYQLAEAQSDLPTPVPDLTPQQFVDAVVDAAAAAAAVGPGAGNVPGAEFTCQFLCTLPAGMVPLKLVVVAERWGFAGQQLDDTRVVLWRDAVVDHSRPDRDESKPRAEIMLHIPSPPSATITVTAGLYGTFKKHYMKTFAQNARAELPEVLEQIRAQLQNQDERRAHPRHPAGFPIRVFPLYPDGTVGEWLEGRCEDVSLGGVRFTTAVPVPTDRLYLEFGNVPAVEGYALYTRLLRSAAGPLGRGAVNVCRFRTAATG